MWFYIIYLLITVLAASLFNDGVFLDSEVETLLFYSDEVKKETKSKRKKKTIIEDEPPETVTVGKASSRLQADRDEQIMTKIYQNGFGETTTREVILAAMADVEEEKKDNA
jgi:hypothetical protein